MVYWTAEPGVLLYGFMRPDVYLEGTLGIAYPSSNPNRNDFEGEVWRIRGALSYAYVRQSSFVSLDESQPEFVINSPGLQQWTLLANSKITTELWMNTQKEDAFFSSVWLKIWQTLPPKWRGLGALKHTGQAQMSGIGFTGNHSSGPWSFSAGLGITSITVGKTIFTFAHPTLELKYQIAKLGDFL